MARKRLVLSVKDAASQLGLAPVTVRAHVARGNLKAQKLAGALWIELEELQRFGRERRPPGHRAARNARWDAVRLQPVTLETPASEVSVSPDGAAENREFENREFENRELVGNCLAEAGDSAPERKSF